MSTKIVVPAVPDDAFKKDRPVSGLLKAQILHLHEAERRLPLRHHTDIYINAIKTEGEAAEYIRAVTEAIHDAHAAAATRRARPRRKDVIEIAAVADETPMRQPPVQKTKTGKGKKKEKS
jgi:ArsR family metal-binding transcriptional regulator